MPPARVTAVARREVEMRYIGALMMMGDLAHGWRDWRSLGCWSAMLCQVSAPI